MILMDYSQVILAALFVSIGNHTNIELTEDLIRHMFLSSIRRLRKKFAKEYGELVICCDGKNSWRREAFPYYKANRKVSRDKSDLDWNELFRIINMLKEEMHENFPYKVLHLDTCEADDIIGALSHEYGVDLNNGSEKILILSGDKDYIQLQTYANVQQYDPVKDKFIRNDDPKKYLLEHIFKGDTGDGIPNILSPDNSLAAGIRQKPMTSKRIDLFTKSLTNMDTQTYQNYERNKKLIDLSQIPEELVEKILSEYSKEKTIGRSKLFNYFVKMKLKNLMQDIEDF